MEYCRYYEHTDQYIFAKTVLAGTSPVSIIMRKASSLKMPRKIAKERMPWPCNSSLLCIL